MGGDEKVSWEIGMMVGLQGRGVGRSRPRTVVATVIVAPGVRAGQDDGEALGDSGAAAAAAVVGRGRRADVVETVAAKTESG